MNATHSVHQLNNASLATVFDETALKDLNCCDVDQLANRLEPLITFGVTDDISSVPVLLPGLRKIYELERSSSSPLGFRLDELSPLGTAMRNIRNTDMMHLLYC